MRIEEEEARLARLLKQAKSDAEMFYDRMNLAHSRERDLTARLQLAEARIKVVQKIALHALEQKVGKERKNMKKGDRLRFTCDLGTIASEDAIKFNGYVKAGDEGVYVGLYPDKKLKGWHLARAKDGSLVPMSLNQFEYVLGPRSSLVTQP